MAKIRRETQLEYKTKNRIMQLKRWDILKAVKDNEDANPVYKGEPWDKPKYVSGLGESRKF